MKEARYKDGVAMISFTTVVADELSYQALGIKVVESKLGIIVFKCSLCQCG